ncbi:hypothetical protein [Leptospira kanakyensis]|uniref:hypothetical protein n=1 Tax=Leptospira kanakyensis TaxID=2484968 RepID=UPI00223D1F63|nr:hypothetical protein [Leptospira kanakyensis]MCW7471373.1 hypothetical protein [Leptospira kanakyensis]
MKHFETFFIKYLLLLQLGAIFFLAFGVRVMWISYIDSYPTMDAYEYYSNAVKLSAEGIVNFYWPIGYSFLLAILMKLGIGNLFYIKLLNVFLSSATTVIAFLISKRFVFDKILRFSCALFLIFYPELIFFTSLLWSETLFIFCFALFFYLFLKEKYFLSSVIYSFSLFVKPILIFFPLVLLVFDRTGKNKIRMLFTIYLVTFLFHLPWTVYVYSKTDRFAFVSTNGSTNLFIGNNKFSSGHYDENGLQNLNQFPTKDMKEIVLDFWINEYQSLPLLVFKKVSYLIFSMPKPWIGSIGIGTNLHSGLPRYIDEKKFNLLLDRYPNENVLLKDVYEMSKVGGLYSLRAGANDFEKSTVSNKLLYSGVFEYELDKQLGSLSSFSYLVSFSIVFCFLLRLTFFGVKANSMYFIPLYFILFYSFFFGDFRFFLPAIPFVIIGNFVCKRSFSFGNKVLRV